MAKVERELSAHPALAAGDEAFVDFFHLNRDDQGHFVFYTHCAHFKPGPGNPRGTAAASVWFGQQSQL
jgi:hypothetical protein